MLQNRAEPIPEISDKNYQGTFQQPNFSEKNKLWKQSIVSNNNFLTFSSQFLSNINKKYLWNEIIFKETTVAINWTVWVYFSVDSDESSRQKNYNYFLISSK